MLMRLDSSANSIVEKPINKVFHGSTIHYFFLKKPTFPVFRHNVYESDESLLGRQVGVWIYPAFQVFCCVCPVLWCSKKREHNSQNCHNLDFENWWHLWPVICFGGHYSGKKVLILFQWALLSIPWVLLQLKENQTLMKSYKKLYLTKIGKLSNIGGI